MLPDFLIRVQNILKRHQVTASLSAHAGQGQLNIRPFLDLTDAEDVPRMKLLTEELYAGVAEVGRRLDRRGARIRTEPHQFFETTSRPVI